MSSLEEKIEKLVEPKIVNLGYELYDVQYVKEGKDYFLRIFIDSSTVYVNPNKLYTWFIKCIKSIISDSICSGKQNI